MAEGTGRVFVPKKNVDTWLDTVLDIPEKDLPCNVSTVAYAVNAARLYREAYRYMSAAFNEVVERHTKEAV